MAQNREKALADSLLAVRAGTGNITLIASGSTPRAGYTVFFEKAPLLIFPPQYILYQTPPEGPSAEVITPFIVTTSAGSSPLIKSLTVTDRNGSHRVTVSNEVPTFPTGEAADERAAVKPLKEVKLEKDLKEIEHKTWFKDLKDHSKDFEKAIALDKAHVIEKGVALEKGAGTDKAAALEKAFLEKPLVHDKSPNLEVLPAGGKPFEADIVKIQKDKDAAETPAQPNELGDVLNQLVDRLQALEGAAEGRPFIPLAERPEVGGGPAGPA